MSPLTQALLELLEANNRKAGSDAWALPGKWGIPDDDLVRDRERAAEAFERKLDAYIDARAKERSANTA